MALIQSGRRRCNADMCTHKGWRAIKNIQSADFTAHKVFFEAETSHTASRRRPLRLHVLLEAASSYACRCSRSSWCSRASLLSHIRFHYLSEVLITFLWYQRRGFGAACPIPSVIRVSLSPVSLTLCCRETFKLRCSPGWSAALMWEKERQVLCSLGFRVCDVL